MDMSWQPVQVQNIHDASFERFISFGRFFLLLPLCEYVQICIEQNLLEISNICKSLRKLLFFFAQIEASTNEKIMVGKSEKGVLDYLQWQKR